MRALLAIRIPTAVLAVVLAGCTGRDEDAEIDAERSSPPAAAPAPPPPVSQPTYDSVSTEMEIEVDVGAKKLFVYRAGAVADTSSVAVGSAEWPTPTGEWRIQQVVWNPEWVPPDEAWAKDEVGRKPGDPKNPLGKVQLVYDPPNSIHATNEPSSIGKAVSHGSIRVTNEVAVKLARDVMEAGGAPKDESFFREVESNPTRKYVVDLPRPVTIRVVAGSDSTATKPR
jgi:lipoprotein-anchoring transpeptidase ErfK/SrfK